MATNENLFSFADIIQMRNSNVSTVKKIKDNQR